ncbi:YdcF family protein [Actinoplanes sp. TRM 88003]|uniref:YdcF family protein n=1 Tax=Paractinoplanes aksuensis TaxID=2939490 RepID=A0ABT1DQP8_9ACTN|nr:YdcF family protein [Actinoplanes aksuensis]MCO8272818.1 YdcF family protein [Actinoplanes aksuensis]
MDTTSVQISSEYREDIETLWAYHDMHHRLVPTDVGIGLGSHDLGVAIVAAELYEQHLFPLIVFTGANSPTTVERFPRGEAMHYREYAIGHGVPPAAVLVETAATNTGANIQLTRQLLERGGVEVDSVTLMCRPYQQRRAYATCRKLWPQVMVQCASRPLSLDDYVSSIGDVNRVINMLVGDTQRVDLYAKRGFAIHQDIPVEVQSAFDRLVAAGFTTRLIAGD